MRLNIFVMLLCLIITSCATNDKQESDANSVPGNSSEQFPSHREFDLQGHRGARGLYPENSIEGFLAAVDLMVNTIELDVVISKDNKVVVSHEPWVSSVICWGIDDKPVPEGKGLNMYEMTYA